jgi:RNA polymerase sigma-70 factor (ECF subfamily)
MGSKEKGRRPVVRWGSEVDAAVDGAAAVFERCADRLYGLALRLTGTSDDAEAALEEALRAHGDGPAGEASLYLRVAHAAHERRRRRRRDVPPIAVDDVVPALDDDGHHFVPMDDWSARIGEPTLDGARHAAVSAAIDALPPDEHTALVLHDVEAAAPGDIAEILGVAAPAVKLHVHRARLFVRQRLAAYFALGERP